MFGKKKKNEYDDMEAALNEQTLASDRIVTKKMQDDDKLAKALVDELSQGNPLIINFEDLDEYGANKMLAFFIGATYALDGKTIPINEKIYLFARKVDLMDGTVKKFIESIPTDR